MKSLPPSGNFSTQIGSMECKGLITAKNSILVLKTGSIEVEIMTKSGFNASKFKKIDYFGKSTQFFLLVHVVVSYGSGLGLEMANGCNRGLLRTKKWSKKT